jgi:hypothetical protein
LDRPNITVASVQTRPSSIILLRSARKLVDLLAARAMHSVSITTMNRTKAENNEI